MNRRNRLKWVLVLLFLSGVLIGVALDRLLEAMIADDSSRAAASELEPDAIFAQASIVSAPTELPQRLTEISITLEALPTQAPLPSLTYTLMPEATPMPTAEPLPTATPTELVGLVLSEAAIYGGPNVAATKLGFYLPQGESATVLGISADFEWYHIRTTRGVEGWISTLQFEAKGDAALLSISTFEPTATPLPSFMRATVIEQAGLFNQPGIGAERLGFFVPPSDTVTVIGRSADNGWAHVITGKGLEAWVAASRIEVDGELIALPVSEFKADGIATVTPDPNRAFALATPDSVSGAIVQQDLGAVVPINNVSDAAVVGSAETQIDTSRVTLVGNGTAASCGESNVAAAVALGGLIQFDCGVSHLTIGLTKPLLIQQPTVLDGADRITLDGRGKTHLIEGAEGVQLTIRGLRFVNGYSTSQGGAIKMGDSTILHVVESEFRDNVSAANGCHGGGAIFAPHASYIVVEESVFQSNAAQNGGAIRTWSATVSIINSLFIDNRAMRNTSVVNVCGGGGAIYIEGGEAHVLRSNTFIGNATNSHGGAVAILGDADSQSVISGSTFERNLARMLESEMSLTGQGGALWAGRAGFLTVRGTTFERNHADLAGGGMWTGVPSTVQNTTFYGNDAVNPLELGGDDWRRGQGGALVSAETTPTLLQNVTIVNNRAGFNAGGTLGQRIAVQNTLIANNSGDWYVNSDHNCSHPLLNQGNNLQYISGVENVTKMSNCGSGIPTADPLLGTFDYHGGLTKTVGILSSSPASNGGNLDTCINRDQRGVDRNNGCDIGAHQGR